MFEAVRDWLPLIGVLGAAIVAALATALGALLGRRSIHDQIAATLNVSAGVAKVDAGKLEVSQQQLQIQREEMVADVTRMVSDTYSKALADINLAHERQGAEIRDLRDVVLPKIRAELAECQQRERAREPLDAARDARIARLTQEVERLGGSHAG